MRTAFSQLTFPPNPVFPLNHTAVWGSYYVLSTGTWGYACCHAIIRGAYCTGETGRQSTEDQSVKSLLARSSTFADTEKEEEEEEENKERRDRDQDVKGKGKEVPSEARKFEKKRHGEGDVILDKERLERAVAEEKKRKAAEGEDQVRRSSCCSLSRMTLLTSFHQVGGFQPGKKSKYNSSGANGTGEVTEEELGRFTLPCSPPRDDAHLHLPFRFVEAYRLSKSHDDDDPMAKLKGEELLPL